MQVWNVTCEENAHICKYDKCVCATKSLQKKLSTRDIPLECLSPWGLEGLELDYSFPKLPLQQP